MNVDAKLLDQIRPFFDVGTNQPFVCMNIHCTVRQHQSEPTIFLITDSTICVLLKTQHKFRVLCKVQWPFITKISMTTKSSFQIYDQNSFFQIEHPDSIVLVSVIHNFLTSILFPNELPEFSIERSFLVQNETFALPQYYRFIYLSIKAGISPPYKLLKLYKKQLKKKRILDFASYPSASSFSELLLDSITVGPSITKLTIPANPKQTNWSYVNKILQSNQKLKKLTFYDKIDSSFIKLADDISNSIESVKFCASQFQNEHAHTLSTFLNRAKVRTLTFSSACDASFLTKLVSSGDVRLITNLKLESIKGIDTRFIFKSFKSLKKLSIKNSEVDVSIFINSVQYSNLEKLSIFHGAAISEIDTDITIPRNLKVVRLSQIRWEQETFTDAWTIFSQHQPSGDNLKLDFSSATPPDEIWIDYFELLPLSPKFPTITQLIFESNPIKSQFVQFLKNLPNLQILSVAGCLSQDSTALIEQFAQFVASSTTLKDLNISGNEYGVLRTSIIPLLNELQKNKSLEVLNVSNNNFGENGLNALKDFLIVNKTVRRINISGNKIDSPDALNSFLEAMEERKLPLFFDFPKDDVENLRKKKKIRSSMILKLKKRHEKIQSIEYTEDEEKQDDMSFDSPQNDSIEDLVNGSEWKLPYPDIPEPDNTASLQQFNTTFSLTSLVQKFYTTQ